ncbi:MAG: pilus assembly protein PilM, partial [Oscillospiraceae bacterium]
MTDANITLGNQTQFPQGESIFALDIGTRSVIGVVGVANGDMFKVLAIESMEHTKRAMIDGQIEDVEQVAKIAGMVKEKLENRLNIKLTHVCVAAAGRSLKTQMAICETKIQSKQLISRNQATEYELAAVKVAYDQLAEIEDEAASFSCVGYSILKYYLDDYPISTLVDHRGKCVKVEVIATFLPNVVIESLYEVMTRIGLSVSSLTLEPIAAMNAIIPQELRMLNLALVDIGAGTSDIAISNGGSVTAYTMVTLAGDEVTDAIVQNYLVDFETAETIKQQLSQGIDTISFQDIMGLEYEIEALEIFETIKGCAIKLCEAIALAILEINGQKPAAVFLVGGGSRLVNMAEMIAGQLDISPKKVAVGGSNYMKKMIESDLDVTAAEYATPMGIAITAMNLKDKASIGITVNGKPVNLFKSSAITAMDVLLMSNYKQNQLMGRSGQSVTFEFNSKKIVVRGGHPIPAQIQINGKAASLTTLMNTGDDLLIKPAVAGEDACPTISSLMENFTSFTVTLNGEVKVVGTQVMLNGERVSNDAIIHDFDVIETKNITTIKQLCQAEEIDTHSLHFTVDGVE